MIRSVERQSEELQKDIKRDMVGAAKEMNIAFMTDFLTSPIGESFITMSMHWITRDWILKNAHLGDDTFPRRPYYFEHFREANEFASGVRCISQEFWW